MGTFVSILSLLLFVFSIAYHYDTSTKINNLNVTLVSNEQRYQHYLYFSRSERFQYREKARAMFQFGYDNYMKYAFPQDELDPVHCRGRGPDIERPYDRKREKKILFIFLFFFLFIFFLVKIIISMTYLENFL